MQKITPFLWFDTQAEEAVDLYTSVFNNAKKKTVARYDEAGAAVSGRPAGSIMTIAFEIEGQEFIALNGGPEFKFTPAISFVVNCDSQEEVDRIWEKLTDGGKEVQCGWLEDKYGVSWQIVPRILNELLASPDKEKAGRVMRAMLNMVKLDSEELKRAAEQK